MNVHLINFGLARQFRDPRTYIHIPLQQNQPLIGTARYTSMNALLGIRLSWRDDIESLAYILIYLVRGSLLWQNIKGDSPEVLEMRTSIAPSTLCEGLPAAFEVFLNYARSLDFKQKPDYQHLRDLFRTLSDKLNTDTNLYLPKEPFLGTPAQKSPKEKKMKHTESELPMIRR